MKVTMHKLEEGQEHADIYYRGMTPDLRKAALLLEENRKQIVGGNRGEKVFLNQQEILYFESVDEKVFAYTTKREVQTEHTLSELEELLRGDGFFRCHKSFIVNLDKIVALHSEIGNRIDAQLENGEHLVISRKYSGKLREILKEERA